MLNCLATVVMEILSVPTWHQQQSGFYVLYSLCVNVKETQCSDTNLGPPKNVELER